MRYVSKYNGKTVIKLLEGRMRCDGVWIGSITYKFTDTNDVCTVSASEFYTVFVAVQ